MTEFQSKFLFLKFSFFIVRKNKIFYLFSSLKITSLEKCITIISSLSFSTISSKIKIFFLNVNFVKKSSFDADVE